MALFVIDCPHCSTKKSGMIVFGVRSFPIERSHEYKSTAGTTHSWDIVITAACQNCFLPTSAHLETRQRSARHDYPSLVLSASKALLGEGNVAALGYTVVDTWPKAAERSIPAHLPETVAKAFRSAENNFTAPDGEDAAAMLYRRAIDVAIREKHPEIKGLLAPRINKLVEKGLLPPSMKDWADQIRLIGNDGAHEPEGVTMEELKPMRGFTEAFLRYFITIPFEVALRRGQIDEDGNAIDVEKSETA